MKPLFKKIILIILRFEARLVLRKYKPRIIAITGSVGKTTTRDSLFAVLSKFYYVRKSEKNFSGDIGIPLAILGCSTGWNDPALWLKNIAKGARLLYRRSPYPDYLILEVGARKPGDIARISKWLPTDIVIITAIGPVPAHVEFFGSEQKVLEEKAGLALSLKPGGLLLVQTESDDIWKYIKRKDVKRASFGFEAGDYQASNKAILYETLEADGASIPVGVSFKVDYRGASIPVSIEGVFGINHVMGGLASIAVAKELGLNILESAQALRSYEVSPGRMRMLRGLKETLIIDDTYNSSPSAAGQAVDTLAELVTEGRKIAILGDMLELGRHTDDAHRDLGRRTASSADLLLAVGPRARMLIEGALGAGMKEKKMAHFQTSFEAGEYMRSKLRPGDMILVKGSQVMRMERVVARIMDRPDYKHLVLVRQEGQWLE